MSISPNWNKQPSVMRHDFSKVPKAEIPRSAFNRSHGLKTTFDSGYLVPVFLDEVLPGDTHALSMSAFCRLSTPIVPVLDNLYLDSFFFFVPYRLIWDNFKKFMGEQANPGDSTSFIVPQMVLAAGTQYAVGSLHDYFGLPGVGINAGAQGITHSSLFHRAYNLINNEWFRDQNMINSVTVDKGDGPDTAANYVLLRRGKRHDYFTSCLPWPQKGTAVTIPLGTSAPILGIGVENNAWSVGPQNSLESDATTRSYAHFKATSAGGANNGLIIEENASTGYPLIRADLSQATAATINSLRQAFQIQRLYERDARGGTRYTELIRSHFGVTSPDSRLQRSEYLGGGSTPINISPIPQTSASVGGTPQGNLAAMGTVTSHGNGFTKSFTEHGLLLGMVSVRADLTYQRTLDRMFSRSTRFDFYWPALAHIGEQAVLTQEIHCIGTTANDTTIFGYQERFAEYRYKQSKITGKFRSYVATPLDVWHLAQDFATAPVLNGTFISENPPVSRVVAVNSEPQFLGDFYFQYKSARPMPTYGVPGLIDHL